MEEEAKIVQEETSVKKAKKVPLWAIISPAVAVCLILSVMIYANTTKKVFPNIYLGDKKVASYTEQELLDTLSEGDILKDDSVILICQGNRRTVTAQELEAEPRVPETAEKILETGKNKGFFGKTLEFLRCLFVKTHIAPDLKINSAKLDKILTEISGPKEIKAEASGYELQGEYLVIKKGKPGFQIDREKALEEIERALVTKEEEKIELILEDTSNTALDADEIFEELSKEPEDAYYEKVDGKIIVHSDKPKVDLYKADLVSAIKSDEKEVKIKVTSKRAEITKEDLEEKLFKDEISTYSSRYSESNVSRSTNVKIATERINGIELMPGEVFSYDKTIGSRTTANGFKMAGVYINNKQELGIGGGICQVSSTLYAATLYANFEIVERVSHSLPVSYMPDGMDATISEGYIDFRFKNTSEYPVKIIATATNGTMKVSILGVKDKDIEVEIINSRTGVLPSKTVRTADETIPQGYKKVVSKGTDGYTVSSVRVVRKNGKEIDREVLTRSRYNATDKEELVNPADIEATDGTLLDYVEGAVPPAEEVPETPDAPEEIEETEEVVEEIPTEETETTETEEIIIEI
ncbi:MAG: VanW family protein [Clostridia bacterium]|nr:VanW family protein [Clostridia bacterium]